MGEQYYVLVQKTSTANDLVSIENRIHPAIPYLEECINLKFHCGNGSPFTYTEIVELLSAMDIEVTDSKCNSIRTIVNSEQKGFETTVITYAWQGEAKYLLFSSLSSKKQLVSDDYLDIFEQILSSNELELTNEVKTRYALIIYPKSWPNYLKADTSFTNSYKANTKEIEESSK